MDCNICGGLLSYYFWLDYYYCPYCEQYYQIKYKLVCGDEGF